MGFGVAAPRTAAPKPNSPWEISGSLRLLGVVSQGNYFCLLLRVVSSLLAVENTMVLNRFPCGFLLCLMVSMVFANGSRLGLWSFCSGLIQSVHPRFKLV